MIDALCSIGLVHVLEVHYSTELGYPFNKRKRSYITVQKNYQFNIYYLPQPKIDRVLRAIHILLLQLNDQFLFNDFLS